MKKKLRTIPDSIMQQRKNGLCSENEADEREAKVSVSRENRENGKIKKKKSQGEL
ncbi:hypothetical protein [Syntrophus gentianae]|uniref:hypothetical protein n=1 Tax=Syntrophus gentianae TaxID=43775 RepID=UPI0015873778|nr:hypothetical protein [Syntrophus gentianae]